MNGFAPSLALIKRLKATQKWAIMSFERFRTTSDTCRCLPRMQIVVSVYNQCLPVPILKMLNWKDIIKKDKSSNFMKATALNKRQ